MSNHEERNLYYLCRNSSGNYAKKSLISECELGVVAVNRSNLSYKPELIVTVDWRLSVESQKPRKGKLLNMWRRTQ